MRYMRFHRGMAGTFDGKIGHGIEFIERADGLAAVAQFALQRIAPRLDVQHPAHTDGRIALQVAQHHRAYGTGADQKNVTHGRLPF